MSCGSGEKVVPLHGEAGASCLSGRVPRTPFFAELTEQYKVNKNKDLKNQIVDLMKDRDKVYQNDKDVIMKYCK